MKKWILSSITVVVLSIVFLWFLLNYLLIPKILLPNIDKYAVKYLPEGISLKVGKASYNPFTGFSFYNVDIASPVSKIISITESDIDLKFLPLLRRHIVLKNFDIKGILFNAERNEQGRWNFSLLLDPFREETVGDWRFSVDKINLDVFTLTHGDLKCNGSMSIVQESDLDYIVDFKNIVLAAGENKILSEGKYNSTISSDKIKINELSGMTIVGFVSYSGEAQLTGLKELNLIGKIRDIENKIGMRFLQTGELDLDLEGHRRDSTVVLHAKFINLKNLTFNTDFDGILKIEDVQNKKDFSGRVFFSGNIEGEMDKPDTLNGDICIRLQGLDLKGFRFGSTKPHLKLVKGLADLIIPKTDFAKGSLQSELRIDLTSKPFLYGLKVDMNEIDLSSLPQDISYFKGIKGIGTFNTALIWKGKVKGSLQGGGYFNIENCLLWSEPVFSNTGEGITTVVKDEDILKQELKSVEGNFDVKDDSFTTDNTYFETGSIRVWLNGGISFSGDCDFTAGVKLRGMGLLRFINPAVFAINTGVNVIANCIEIKIKGKVTDLSTDTAVQPLGWLTNFFSGVAGAEPDRYDFEELWKQGGGL